MTARRPLVIGSDGLPQQLQSGDTLSSIPATRRMSVIGSLNPDTSGNVWWEPSSIMLTNDRFPTLVLRFKDTATKVGAYGCFAVPKDYVGSPKLIVRWSTTAITGNVVFATATKSIAAGESMDPSTDDETATVTTAAPGTANLLADSSLTLTASVYVIDDQVVFTLSRDGASASDTTAADVIVHDVLFEYADQ